MNGMAPPTDDPPMWASRVTGNTASGQAGSHLEGTVPCTYAAVFGMSTRPSRSVSMPYLSAMDHSNHGRRSTVSMAWLGCIHCGISRNAASIVANTAVEPRMAGLIRRIGRAGLVIGTSVPRACLQGRLGPCVPSQMLLSNVFRESGNHHRRAGSARAEVGWLRCARSERPHPGRVS